MPGTKTERETDQNPYKIYKRKYTKNIYVQVYDYNSDDDSNVWTDFKESLS